MADDFLSYFDAEYAALRRMAKDLPDSVAKSLQISRDGTTPDPHVERLLEGVAYLGARVQSRLDDEFPELTDGLLGLLYPQLLTTFPSTMMARLVPARDSRTITRIERGAVVRTEAIGNTACRFRTTADVSLWPVALDGVELLGRPLPVFKTFRTGDSAACLRIGLRSLEPSLTFEQMAGEQARGLGRLRLHLRGGPIAHRLYELLCGHVTGLVVADRTERGPDPYPLVLDAGNIAPGAFSPAEAIIPWPIQGFPGFRLLLEYFALPQKFLCVDIDGIDGRAIAGAGDRLDLYLYLDQLPPGLEREIGPENLALGCVPLVNLFEQRCEPIDFDWTRTEYRVDPQRNMPDGMEVWSLQQVGETRPDGSSRPLRRLFHQGSPSEAADSPGYLPVTRPAVTAATGTDTFLATSFPGIDPKTHQRSRLSVTALCTNRDLPASLPFGAGHPRLDGERGFPRVAAIEPLTPPTATLRPPKRDARNWQLISHLSLNHLALAGEGEAVQSLRDLLGLYDLKNTAETRSLVNSLLAVSRAETAARLPGAKYGSFCRGVEVTLTFSADAWLNSGAYLLASVLEKFFQLHVTVNGFVRTRAKIEGHPDIMAQWPPRSGTRDLL